MEEIEITDTIKSVYKGFGEHSNPVTHKAFIQAKTVMAVALTALGISFAVSTLAVVSVFVPFIPIVPGALIAISITVPLIFCTLAIISVINYLRSKHAYYGCINRLVEENTQHRETKDLGVFSYCDSIVCDDSKESYKWKKKLIEKAQHNIVLSGNYCGGNTFSEILAWLEQKLVTNETIKIVLISSNMFISKAQCKKIKRIAARHPDRFQFIDSPNVWRFNPGLKKCTNHTKSLVIDYGEYFLVGDSNLEDKYTRTTGLGDRSLEEAFSYGKLDTFLPENFRDQDFVFHNREKNGVGKRVFLESLKLGLHWESFTKARDFNKPENSCLVKELFQEDSSKIQLMHHIPEFETHPQFVKGCATKIYSIGPDQAENSFANELMTRIKEAKERIVIDHMYFHPTGKILNALADAAERGVKISIITNGILKNESPLSHAFFAPRNRHNYSKLRNKIIDRIKEKLNIKARHEKLHNEYEKNPNFDLKANLALLKSEWMKEVDTILDVREFCVQNTTLHKKIIVIDDYVFGGSSNLGYKSLVTMSDSEMNFEIKNRKVADRTAEIALNVDGKLGAWVPDEKGINHLIGGSSIKITDFEPSWSRHFMSILHRVLAPLIG